MSRRPIDSLEASRAESAEGVLDKLFDGHHMDEFFPLLHQLRELQPVHRTCRPELGDCHVLTRHDDITAVLRNPANTEWVGGYGTGDAGALTRMFSEVFTFLPKSQHDRIRRLVIRAFTRARVEALRDRTQKMVDDLLDEVADRERMEVVSELAYPLPIMVICLLLGVPPSDYEQMRSWAWAVARAGDFASVTEEILAKGDDAAVGFGEYFAKLIEQRKRNPGDDLVTALLAAREGTDRLGDREIIATCMFLLQAGHETTSDLIGNGLLALLRNPDQMRRLIDDPDLTENAVEEMLRYDGSVQFNTRMIPEGQKLSDGEIAPGEVAVVVYGAANRDPAVFTDPDRFDITRTEGPHVAFALGTYYCVGAHLARMEIAVTIRSLLDRFPGLRLIDERPDWRPTIVLRGLKSLNVEWHPGA